METANYKITDKKKLMRLSLYQLQIILEDMLTDKTIKKKMIILVENIIRYKKTPTPYLEKDALGYNSY